LLAGIISSNSTARAANLVVALLEAALCFFAPQHADSVFAFDCASERGAPSPTAHTLLATATAEHLRKIFSILIFLSCQSPAGKV
jgi:hypothetical protein